MKHIKLFEDKNTKLEQIKNIIIKSKNTNESIKLKYLRTFESFKMNEDLNIEDDYELPDLEEKKEQLNDLFPHDCIDSSHYEMFGFGSEKEFEDAIGYDEIDSDRIIDAIKSKIEELFPGFEVNCGLYDGNEKCYIRIFKGEDYLKFDLEIDIY